MPPTDSNDLPSEATVLDEADVAACLRVLQAIERDRGLLAQLSRETRHAVLNLTALVAAPSRDERRKLQRTLRRQDRDEKRAHDGALLAKVLNRSARRASGYVQAASTADASPLLLPLGPSDGEQAQGDPAATGAAADPATADANASATIDGGAPEPPEPIEELHRARDCYVCKQSFRRLHFFYDSLCPDCAALNWQKRNQTAPLDGRVALITGGRIKIGYQAALILLRAGAEVIVTTRFPRDAARRFGVEPDYALFSSRLHLFGLDLMRLPFVERFADHLAQTFKRLDFLINNAAQTVRRPPAFYQHLLDEEAADLPAELHGLFSRDGEMRRALGVVERERPLLAPADPQALIEATRRDGALFPPGRFDLDAQQLDLRPDNSWRMALGEVPTVELLEVHLVNAIAPCVLTARLKPLLLAERTPRAVVGQEAPYVPRHVINVSAMEARFARNKKTDKHPHTNMAKAALNMMTRTSAQDYANDGIFMNSVDTGWVTDEDPLVHVARKQRVHDFHPPLDAVDGAARVLDPIFMGELLGQTPWGMFFKDYRSITW